MNPVHLAHYLVKRFGHVPGGVTPMKLQKLLYYVKAWGLVDGEDRVDGNFVKMTYGPVNWKVYHHFKEWGATPIGSFETLAPGQEPQGAAREFVEFVGNSYARFPAVALSKMTHEEKPWLETELRHTIPADLIASFYTTQPFADNFPLDLVRKEYVPVQGHMDHAFTLDMSRADADRTRVYASYTDYLSRLERAGYLSEDDWLSGLLA